MRNLTWMLLAVLAAGCGEFRQKFGRNESGMTQVQFALPSDELHASGVLVRGMMIYMARTDNQFVTNLKLSSEDEAATASITIPNGVYEMFAVGWNGASPFQVSGGLRCAKRSVEDGTAVTLGGGSTTISLVMNNANCELAQSGGNVLYPADVAGTPFSSAGNVFNTRVKFCANASTGGGAPSPATCTASGQTNFAIGKRFQAELVTYVRNGGAYQRLPDPSRYILGDCNAVATTGVLDLGPVPIGDPTDSHGGIFALRLRIHANADSTCTGAPLQIIDFPEGLSFPSVQYGSPLVINSDGTNAEVLFNAGS